MLVTKPLFVQKWTDFPMYMPKAGPTDDSAANPGMFISRLQFQV